MVFYDQLTRGFSITISPCCVTSPPTDSATLDIDRWSTTDLYRPTCLNEPSILPQKETLPANLVYLMRNTVPMKHEGMETSTLSNRGFLVRRVWPVVIA